MRFFCIIVTAALSTTTSVVGQRAPALRQPAAPVVPGAFSENSLLLGRGVDEARPESAAEEAPAAFALGEAAGVVADGGEDAAAPPGAQAAKVPIFILSRKTTGGFWGIGATLYALDVSGGKCHAGNKVHLWKWNKNNKNQQWKPIKDGRIESVKCPGMYIEYQGNGKHSAGAVLGNGSKKPGWTWKDAAFYYWYVQNEHGMVLDIGGGKAKNGAAIYLYTKHGGHNQQWWPVTH